MLLDESKAIMSRRDFLQSSGIRLGLLSASLSAAKRNDGVSDPLSEHRITSITGFQPTCPRPKLVGKKSHLDIHGRVTNERCLWIRTNHRVDGVGIGNLNRDLAKKIIGQTVDQIWDPKQGAVGLLGRADHAIFDFVGKILGVPARRLIGNGGLQQDPAYDKSIYFADLLSEYEERGVARILEEVEAGLDAGHRALKVKVGRGYRWMPKQDGFRRDVELVTAIRKLVGAEIRLMVDSNNGYSFKERIQFLEAIDTELFFVEEMFPEDPESNLRLKEYIQDQGWKALVADGESAREVAHFDPYLEVDALDVFQPDIRAFGLSLQWQLSELINSYGRLGRLAPHNWGSHLGVYMQAILASGIPDFLMAEMDSSSSDLFDTSAFKFADGLMTVPQIPGVGLQFRQDVFESTYRPQSWTATLD